MPSLELLLKLRRRVHRGIHLAPQLPLGRGQRRDHLGERDLPYHHHVDVADAAFGAARHRAVNEDDRKTLAQWLQSPAQNVDGADGLAHNAAQLGQDRASRVGLEVPLPTFGLGGENAQASEAG